MSKLAQKYIPRAQVKNPSGENLHANDVHCRRPRTTRGLRPDWLIPTDCYTIRIAKKRIIFTEHSPSWTSCFGLRVAVVASYVRQLLRCVLKLPMPLRVEPCGAIVSRSLTALEGFVWKAKIATFSSFGGNVFFCDMLLPMSARLVRTVLLVAVFSDVSDVFWFVQHAIIHQRLYRRLIKEFVRFWWTGSLTAPLQKVEPRRLVVCTLYWRWYIS